MAKKSTTIARRRKVWSPDKCIEILGEALDSYEKRHPHWRIEVLISLVSGSLRSLKHYIEEKRDSEITWESPFVELHYPVEWDWKIPCGRDITHSKLISGKITARNTSDTNGVRKTLADYDKKKAYQPITIGLFIEPQIRGKDVSAPNPAEWPAKDREEFWAALLREMEKLADKFIPPNESRTSEILQLNAELEVPLASSHPEERKKAIKQIFEALSAAGQVLHMDMRPAVKSGVQALGSHENLCLLLRQRDRATTATEKGKALEELMSALFGTIRGFEVKERRVVTATEEIDLLILNDSDDPRLKREAAYILVECKNWSTKCGKNEFVAFQEKIRNRKGRSSVGVLVSWNGFAETITKEMLRSSHEKLLIVPIDGGQIRSAVEQGTFYQVLVSASDKATHL